MLFIVAGAARPRRPPFMAHALRGSGWRHYSGVRTLLYTAGRVACPSVARVPAPAAQLTAAATRLQRYSSYPSNQIARVWTCDFSPDGNAAASLTSLCHGACLSDSDRAPSEECRVLRGAAMTAEEPLGVPPGLSTSISRERVRLSFVICIVYQSSGCQLAARASRPAFLTSTWP